MFCIFLGVYGYFIAFCAGYAVKMIKNKRVPKELARDSSLSQVAFRVQNYCYSFFLIHGGILLFSIKVLKLHFLESLITSFLLTAVLSWFHYNVSVLLLEKMTIRFKEPQRRHLW